MFDFEILGEKFSLEKLLNSNINNSDILRLIKTVRSNDPSYIVHEPMEEDIILPNDNWSCHIAEKIGVSFEFVLGALSYVSLTYGKDVIFDMKKIRDDIFNVVVNEWNGDTFVSICSKETPLPNRVSLIS